MAGTTIIDCSEPWFKYLKIGMKPVEGRKNTPKFSSIKKGDIVVFRSSLTYETFNAQVTKINHYEAIEQYLCGEILERALPGVASIEAGKRIYLQWSTEEEVKECGFIGIYIKVLSKVC